MKKYKKGVFIMIRLIKKIIRKFRRKEDLKEFAEKLRLKQMMES